MDYPLKPSLEGWKLFFGGEGVAFCFSLETFLRGMETINDEIDKTTPNTP